MEVSDIFPKQLSITTEHLHDMIWKSTMHWRKFTQNIQTVRFYTNEVWMCAIL